MSNARRQPRLPLEITRLEDRVVPAVSVTVTPTHQSGYVAEKLTFHRTGSLGAAATVPYTLSETTGAPEYRAVTFGPGVADVTLTHLPVKHDGETLANTFTVAVNDGGGATLSVPLVDGSASWPSTTALSLVAVVVQKDADGAVVGITLKQVGGTSADVDVNYSASGANVATSETTVVPIEALDAPPAAGAAARPDQSATLKGYLVGSPPDVQAFIDALSDLKPPLTRAELALLEDVIRGKYGANLGILGLAASDAAATAIATHLSYNESQGIVFGSRYYQLLRDIANGVLNASFPPAICDQVKATAARLLQSSYGTGFWDYGSSDPDAINITNAAFDLIAPGLGSDDFDTRQRAESDLNALLQDRLAHGDYVSFFTIIDRLQQLALNSNDPEVQHRAYRLLQAYEPYINTDRINRGLTPIDFSEAELKMGNAEQ